MKIQGATYVLKATDLMPESQRVIQGFSVTGTSAPFNMASTSINSVYKISPESDKVYYLERMSLVMIDNGQWDAVKYGASSALTTGITISLENANQTIVNLTPLAITNSAHWVQGAASDVIITQFATGSNMMAVRWTFSGEKGGKRLKVDGSKNEEIKMKIGTPLSASGAALQQHYVFVHGVWEDPDAT